MSGTETPSVTATQRNRRWATRAAAGAGATAVALLAVLELDTDSAAVVDQPRRSEAPVALEEPGAEGRLVVDATRRVSEPAPAARSGLEAAATWTASAVIVADPRPGDLRVDPTADVLPLDYRPAPPTRTILDVAYGPDPAHQLDIRLPADADAPVIVFLHSGGWVGGSREFVPDMVLRFVERGYAVVSVDYRLAPEHPFPEPVQDVKRAIRWLKAYGRRHGTIDGHRMVLLGTSAGGHLASFTAATPGRYEPADLAADEAAVDSTVAGVISMVGPTDLVQLYSHDHVWARSLTSAFVGCDPCAPDQLAAASPPSHLHDQLPPAYWAYGAADNLVALGPQGEAIAEAWAAAVGAGMSWIDVVDAAGHDLDEATVNIRRLDEFVDFAVGRSRP